jgi:HK97 family phage major capsid protein
MKNLVEQRGKIVSDMRQIAANPKGQNGDFDKEQETTFERMKTDLSALEKRIERQQTLDDAERRMQGQPLTTSGDNHLDDALRGFSLRRAVASMVPDLAGHIDCGRERELSQEIARRSGRTFQGIAVPMQVFEQRVMTTAAPAGGPGSNIIGTDHLGGQYIDRLRSALVVRKLGARVLSGLVGHIDIPKLKGSATAGWFAENAAISATDAELSKVSLTPKHVGARTEFSRNMLLQSSPDIEDLLRGDFAQILAGAVDKAAILGGGANEPVGLLANGDLNDSISMATPSWATVLQLIEAVQTADSEGTAFLTSPKVVRILRSLLAAEGMPQFVMTGPGTLAGYPCAASTLVPTNLGVGTNKTALIFGKWDDMLLGYWSAFDLLVNPYESTAYSKGNVQVRGIITMDVAVRHIESFAAATDI